MANPSEATINDRVCEMSIQDLKNQLSNRGLNTKGSKSQLQRRLADILYEEIGIGGALGNLTTEASFITREEPGELDVPVPPIS